MKEILYNKIGTGYNITRKADPYLLSRLIYFLQPEKGKLYLDIGCGTGNYTVALAQNGFDLYGVDPSEKMLSIARDQSKEVNWLIGSADKIPAADNSIDAAIATLTIHHWKNLEQAFKEIHRILKEKTRIVFFTSTPEQMNGYWLNHYFPKMLERSICQMPSFNKINNALTKAGFSISTTEKYFISDDLKDHFLYVGKHKPHLYLDPSIRQGISSFADLANEEEVQSGLAELESDIQSGRFDDIKNHYTNDVGDYLFIVASRK